MATLTGNQIKDTYYKLVQVDNGQLLQNGLGSPLTSSVNLSGSFHVTGSQTVGGDLLVTGSGVISGSLTVEGDLTARSIITQLTQSTVLYKSGSTQFGDSADDTHIFTGSLNVSGALQLGYFNNVSYSLNAVEVSNFQNSASAATALAAQSSSTATALRTEYTAGDTSLSSSAHTHRVALDTVLSGSAHTRREEISSSFATTIAGLDASGYATDAELSAVSGAFDSTIDTLASTGSNNFSGLQEITGDLHLTGSFDKRNGDFISVDQSHPFGQTQIIQTNNIVRVRALPTASAIMNGQLSVVYYGDDTTVVNAYGTEIQLGTYVDSGKFTENIKLGTTSSLFTISGSTEMTGSLVISGAIDSNEKANKIRFHYDTEGDLPSATDYHGMFAHVHATGLAYFAHGGNWVKLASSGSEASAIRSEYAAADTTLSGSAHTQRDALVSALSGSAHTQRTALSASSAAIFETSASVASDYISIERLKALVAGAATYDDFTASIAAL